MEDLAKLQQEVLDAFPEAAKRGEVEALSALGALIAEIDSACRDWRIRLQRILTAKSNEPPKEKADLGAVKALVATVMDDFTGKPIRGFSFDGSAETVVSSYAEMLVELARLLAQKRPEKINEAISRVRGQKPYLSKSGNELRVPHQVRTGLFIETNLPANLAAKVATDLVRAFGFPASSLTLDVVPFRTRAVKRTANPRSDASNPHLSTAIGVGHSVPKEEWFLRRRRIGRSAGGTEDF